MRATSGEQPTTTATTTPPPGAAIRPAPALSRSERAIAPFIPSIADAFFACVLFGGLFITQSRILGVDGDSGWTLRLGQIILAHGLPRAEPLLSVAPAPMPGGWVDWEWLAQVVYALAFRLGGLNGVAALACALVAVTLTNLLTILRRHGASLPLALLLTMATIPLVAMIWSARAQLFSLPLTLWWAEWLWRYWRDGDARRWLWRFPLLIALWVNLHGGFVGGLTLLALATALAWALALAVRWRPTAAIASLPHPRPRDLTLTLGACLLATLCTPWGVNFPLHLFAFAQNPLIAAYTQEYQSPDFHQWSECLFLALLVALIAVWLWVARHTASAPNATAASAPAATATNATNATNATLPQPPSPLGGGTGAGRRPSQGGGSPEPLALLLCGAWTLLTFVYVRLMPFWPLIALPYLVDALGGARAATLTPGPFPQPVGRGAQAGRPAGLLARVGALARRVEATDALVGRGGLWRALALAALVGLLLNGGAIPGTPWATRPALAVHYDAQALPVAAVARLRITGLPAGRGFNPYEWGGYLDDVLPQYHVFIDSRSDVYGPQFLLDYLTISDVAPGWQRLLDHYRIAWALLPSGSALAQLLTRMPPWRCQPADAQGVATLCVRAPASIPVDVASASTVSDT